MKKTLGQLTAAALCLFLGGCSITPHQPNSTPDSTGEAVLQNTEATASATTASATTSSTTSASSSQTTAATTTQETTTSVQTTTTVTTTERFPAESTDYGRSDEPHPLNFTYVFTTEGIGLRIEGGNYQTLHYALSAETASYLAEHYIIRDCNYDGCYDLLLPVKDAAENKTFALFLWDTGTQQYRQTPIELVNPYFRASEKTVHSRVKGNAVVFTYEIYRWEGSSLQRVAQYIVNTQQLTVTANLYENGSITQHKVDTYETDSALYAFVDGL